jgi:metallo-beta-lactamase family protein
MVRSARIVETADPSRKLNSRHEPMVIIAASGMATGGRVVHHLRAFAPDAATPSCSRAIRAEAPAARP